MGNYWETEAYISDMNTKPHKHFFKANKHIPTECDSTMTEPALSPQNLPTHWIDWNIIKKN